MTTITDNQGTSTRPYLLRALHDWCTDNGFTPYIAVHVDETVQVPHEHVKNNEIVLNVGFEATSGLKLGNEAVEFRARFGGVSRDIVVPVDHVVAIYARENGQGMAFPVPTTDGIRGPVGVPAAAPGAGAMSTGTAAIAGPRTLRLASGADGKPAAVAPVLAAATTTAAPAAGTTAPTTVVRPPAGDDRSDAVRPDRAPLSSAPPNPVPPNPVPPDPVPPRGTRPSLKRIK